VKTRTVGADPVTSSGELTLPLSPVGVDRVADRWPTRLAVVAIGIVVATAMLAYVTASAGTNTKLNDFYREAWPAYQALAHGHVVEFLRLGPAYVGSLVLRAPFALIPSAWSGGPKAAYFASALPCLLAVVAFCTWLAAEPRRRGGIGWGSRINPIVLCIFNPIMLVAVLGGHPEEILGGVLCVAGVFLAADGRVGWSGLLIGLAVVNKPWALVAVPVALAAMPMDRRRGLWTIAATAGVVLIPVALVRAHGFSVAAAGTQLGTQTGGTIFNPPQLLWWFGPHSWIVSHAREGIVLSAVTCAALWSARRSHARRSPIVGSDDLLLLALVLLLRAALDPWNNLYYHVPFLLALMAYEVRSGRMPTLTIIYTLALLIVVPVSGFPPMSHDVRAAAYAVVVVPTIGWLAARLYLSAGAWERLAAMSRAALPRRSRADEVPAA
jgi:hypothetical protein